MTEQQFYGEIAKMIMEALKRVEHDLNLAVGEMKITLELICAPWWSPICQKDELPPLYMPLFM